ncbi:MAG: metallophosphoesterase [Clostridia bacterium]|nr:metallophosphoesterase [Clostridia bacterium]
MIYVTSDWHGCELKTVKSLFKKAGFTENDFCFVLGNVIDCGENGVELIEWLMEQYNVELLLGSHESMLLMCEDMFINDGAPEMNDAQMAILKKWNEMGGMPTISALKKKKADELEYIFEYLNDAPLFETVSAGGRDFVLTHSGLGGFKKGKKLGDYAKEEILWNTPKLSDRYFDEATVVFGHVPTYEFGSEYEGKMLFTETWADVNPGEGYSPALLRLDDMKEFYAD